MDRKQLLTAMYGHVHNDEYVYKLRGNLHATLKVLKEKRLVKETVAQQPRVLIYSLTAKGLDLLYRIYNVSEGYRGTGFDDDFGYIDYKTHAPKLGGNALHFYYQGWVLSFLMKLNNRAELENTLTNIRSIPEKKFELNEILQKPNEILKLTSIDARIPYDKRITNICSYRDNLHAAPNYEIKSTKANEYRPDGEIEIGAGNNYFIEVDSGSESGTKLSDKFVKLYYRLKALKDNGLPLPKGVLFVCYGEISNSLIFEGYEANDMGISRSIDSSRFNNQRYKTIYHPFEKKCALFSDDVPILMTTIEEFESYVPLLTEKAELNSINVLRKEMQIYEKYVLPPNESFNWRQVTGAGRKTSPYALIGGNYYVFYHIESFDGLSWKELKNAFDFMTKNVLPKVNAQVKVIPVAFFQKYFPYPPIDEGKLTKEDKKFYLDVMIVDVGGSQPYWYDINNKPVNPPFHTLLPDTLKMHN